LPALACTSATSRSTTVTATHELRDSLKISSAALAAASPPASSNERR